MPYPYGTPATGVLNIFTGTSFSPNDVVMGIRDNYSAVNRTTMLNSLGYQVGLLQNFVNSTYLGRPAVPVQNGYFGNAWGSGQFTVYSGDLLSAHTLTSMYPEAFRAYETDNLLYVNETLVRPSGFRLSSTQDGAHYVDLNKSGLYFSNFNSSIGSSTLQLMVASGITGDYRMWTRLEATGTDYFRMGNYSDSGYSGVFELYGTRIDLSATRTNLQGSTPTANVSLTFCGSHLTISGGTSASNIRTYNNIFPTTNGEREMGDSSYYWKDMYSVQYTSEFAASTSTFTTRVGGVCGQLGLTFESQALRQSDGALLSSVGLYPNQVYLSRNLPASPNPAMSGYLRINSSNQLEFFKIGSSGWVLTNY